MSEKWIDLGPESEMVVPGDIVTAVDGSSTDAQVPSAKCLDTMAGDVEEALRIVRSGRVGGWIYGYVIDESDSNPATRVSYIEDNKNFSPLYMDFTNDALVWGDWQDFVEEYFRPAMLKSDGTIDYYLDPNDLTKKADGVTASDVANTSYDGNAMLIVKPIYYNIERIGAYQVRVRFSNVKQGDTWYNWTHLKSDGTYADFCGWPLFTGSVISSKLRSIATGAVPEGALTASGEYTAATANGSNWYPTTWADEMMFRLLFPLLCKSTDSQAQIGGGATISSSLTFRCGDLKTSGFFYGKANVTGSTQYGSKFLGMENVWGERWRRFVGLAIYNYHYFVKLTPSTIDGSTCIGWKFSTTTTDYTDNYIPSEGWSSNFSQKNITNIFADALMAGLPSNGSGTNNSLAYADNFWVDNGLKCPMSGGPTEGLSAGIFATTLGATFDYYYKFTGASLSYHFY